MSDEKDMSKPMRWEVKGNGPRHHCSTPYSEHVQKQLKEHPVDTAVPSSRSTEEPVQNGPIGENPMSAIGYMNRAHVCKEQGQFEQAIDNYTKAIELDPQNVEAYIGRGTTYHADDQYDMAISDYTKAIEIEPGHGLAYYVRGLSYHEKGIDSWAICDYSKTIEISNFLPAYEQRALSWYTIGFYEDAWFDVFKIQQLGGQIDPALQKKLDQMQERLHDPDPKHTPACKEDVKVSDEGEREKLESEDWLCIIFIALVFLPSLPYLTFSFVVKLILWCLCGWFAWSIGERMEKKQYNFQQKGCAMILGPVGLIIITMEFLKREKRAKQNPAQQARKDIYWLWDWFFGIFHD